MGFNLTGESHNNAVSNQSQSKKRRLAVWYNYIVCRHEMWGLSINCRQVSQWRRSCDVESLNYFVPLHPVMRLSNKLFIFAGAVVLAACGSSQKSILPPTVVVDSRPAIADTISGGRAFENDTVAIDTVYADTINADSIPYIRATSSWRRDIRNGIDEILESPLLETSVCGLEVWDLDDDVSLYRHGELQRMRPASTMKTITAVTALEELGTDYRFSTRVYYDGLESDSSRVWHGNLYVVGGMDPSISSADISRLADDIRKLGVDSIMGCVYADQSFKDGKKWGAGWCWDDDDNPLLLPLKYDNKDTFADVFISRLRQRGIYVSGSQGTKALPSGAKEVSSVSRPLRSVMRPMLKNSNNHCAESVFYAMVHHAYGNGATARQGQTMVRKLMTKAGVSNAASYDIVDGSGLSLYDYVSPHAEVMMLRHAWQNKDVYDFFRHLLPVAGSDGTLRRRMRGTRAAGNVHAKTGTVTGVRSLCGYLTASNGHHIAFSIINQGVNGDDGTAAQARNMQDRICELLASNPQ